VKGSVESARERRSARRFFCDYGFNIRLGGRALLNFNCVILDVVEVTIGDGTQIGPAVRSTPPIIPRPGATQVRP
jgi:maltose O-acetyltransferase